MQFSDLYDTRSRKIVVALMTIVLCLGANLSTPGQSYRSKVERKATDAVSSNPPSANKDAIRPFRVNVPQKELTNLRRRLSETRWPDKETVDDRSQGAQVANLQELVRYWGSRYDRRKAEATLNSYPQFVTNIDGVDIHFIHVRSRHKNALPIIISHGWPGSVFEQIKLIGPLANPTAFGGKAEDAFDVVIPSLPGYGFSGRPSKVGWDPSESDERGTFL